MTDPTAPIYLDHAATTPLWPQVAQWLAREQPFGNPSSAHAAGRKAAELLQKARAWVAEDLQVEPSWVVFTASATESDNLAIQGSARAILAQRQQSASPKTPAPLHLVCSSWEHPAVLAPMQRLAQEGAELCIAEPDERGQLLARHVLAKVKPYTALVSVMAVHNELGLRLPVQEIGQTLAQHPARFHCDAVQAVSTQPVLPQELGIDLLTLTAHKIGGPKGVGVLVRSPELEVWPLCVGGGQEGGLRPGTENPGMAFAFALALRQTIQTRDERLQRYTRLRSQLLEGLRTTFPGMAAVADRADCAPNIVTVCLPGQRGSALVRALDERGICASAGAACHAHDSTVLPTASKLGIDPELARGTLRLSLGPETSPADIESVLSALAVA